MTQRDPISVLITDDQRLMLDGLRTLLELEPDMDVVEAVEDGEAAVDAYGRLHPDVVLMDVRMPGMDGVEATRRVKDVSPRTQIVVLTSYHEDEHIFPALQAGAISYVLKDLGMEELAEAILGAARGEATLHPQVASLVIRELQGSKVDEINPYTELTHREMDVLRLIAGGMNNSRIAEELVVSEYTVKGHVSNILSKLHLADRTQAAVYAWQKGVVRRD